MSGLFLDPEFVFCICVCACELPSSTAVLESSKRSDLGRQIVAAQNKQTGLINSLLHNRSLSAQIKGKTWRITVFDLVTAQK